MLASIPQFETKKPSSFLAEITNTHLLGFSFVHVECTRLKTKARLSNKDVHDLILTMMSSTYTSIMSLMRPPNVL
jgi:hypothetical protein